MNEIVGLRLIEELKNDPKKFYDDRKSYQLLQAYYKGLSKDTLRELLRHHDKRIRQTALWITSELGRNAGDLLKEVVSCIDDDDVFICYHALKIVSSAASGEYMDDFIRVFTFLEHRVQNLRILVMLIISGLSSQRINEAYAYSASEKILNDSHEKGLLFLLNVNTLTACDITQMISSDDAVIRKYGAIVAEKLYKKYPEIINEALNSEDSDVREFSGTIVDAKNESAQYFNNREKS